MRCYFVIALALLGLFIWSMYVPSCNDKNPIYKSSLLQIGCTTKR